MEDGWPLLGFQRGGTTFTQRLLNCRNEVLLWGENHGIVGGYKPRSGSTSERVTGIEPA
jgi:hypothetical protein